PERGPYRGGECEVSGGRAGNRGTSGRNVGAGYRTGEAARGPATPGVFEDVDDETAWNVETAVRFWRCFGTAEYFQMTDEVDNPVDAPAVHSRGYHAQLGIMAIAKHLEVAVRDAEINPDSDAANANVTEKRLATTYYLYGHYVKLQLDGGRVTYGPGFASLSSIAKRNIPALGTRLKTNTTFEDDQYRLQAQIVF